MRPTAVLLFLVAGCGQPPPPAPPPTPPAWPGVFMPDAVRARLVNEDGAPLAKWTVHASPSAPWPEDVRLSKLTLVARTGEDGAFALVGDVRVPCRLYVVAPSGVRRDATFLRTPGLSTDGRGSVVVRSKDVVFGRITVDCDVSPTALVVTARIGAETRRAKADEEGFFDFVNLPPEATCVLTTVHSAFENLAPVSVRAGEDAVFHARLRFLPISGRLLGADGAPARWTWLRFEPARGATIAVETLEDGTFLAGRIIDDDYEVLVQRKRPPHVRDEFVPIGVVHGGATGVELRAPR